MNDEGKKRKVIRLNAGDVFEFTASDGRLAYGVVVIGGKVPYVIILKSLHKTAPKLADLASDEIALVGWTMDALVHHGRWRVVMHDYPARPDIPYPNWKLDLEGNLCVTDFSGKHSLGRLRPDEAHLDFRWSRAPIAFQLALEALHGFGEWREDYSKLLAANMGRQMTREPLPSGML